MNLLARHRHYATAVLSLLAAGLLLAGCEDSTGPEENDIPVPTILEIDGTVVSPGDTVMVTGSDFDGDPALNRVIFNNTLARAVPFDGNITVLRVVVPAYAMSGAVSVTRAGQPEAAVGPEVTVERGVGDVWVAGGGRDVALDTPGGSEYLVIPFATGGLATENHPYSLSGVGLPPTASQTAGAVDPDYGRVALTDGTTAFDAVRRRAARELYERIGPPRRPGRRAETPAAPAQQFRQFNVWNQADGGVASNPDNYTTVTAELRYTGDHVLVYADVDTLATGNLTYADFESFGRLYDDEVRPTALKYFGPASDIDNNGKVIMLITPVVNSLTPRDVTYLIGGFFFEIDLYSTSRLPAGTTNHAEIFYLLAADPAGRWSRPLSAARVVEENTMTIAHENEHLVSVSWRMFNEPPNSLQAAWLEEGMAHMAEDLLALETGNAGYNSNNEERGRRYRLNPGAISIEDGEAPINQRGGIYLFLRLVGDRYGNDVFKQIVQSDCVGRECIEKITGAGFYTTVGEFLAAMYLSGSGVTASTRFNYQSIDLADFGTLANLVSAAYDGTDVGGDVRRASGDFFVFGDPTTPTSRVSVSTTSSSMGLRTLFVRTQ